MTHFLAIETSCDETAGVFTDELRVRSNASLPVSDDLWRKDILTLADVGE